MRFILDHKNVTTEGDIILVGDYSVQIFKFIPEAKLHSREVSDRVNNATPVTSDLADIVAGYVAGTAPDRAKSDAAKKAEERRHTFFPAMKDEDIADRKNTSRDVATASTSKRKKRKAEEMEDTDASSVDDTEKQHTKKLRQ